MKALLVTTVERIKTKTMGGKETIVNRTKIIPWKEVAEIEVIGKGRFILTQIEAGQVVCESMKIIDLSDPATKEWHEIFGQVKMGDS